MRTALLAALAVLLCLNAAEARRARHVSLAPVPVAGAMVDDRYPNLRLPEAYGSARAVKRHARHSHRQAVPLPKPRPKALVRGLAVPATPVQPDPVRFTSALPAQAPAVIGGRPSGCPHRFCGCALSLKLFGRIIPMLNLAANWMGFPRVDPAPGMVAARHGHVFQLLAHRSGSRWRVWDANSGHGRIRVHDRSIAGYAIVNPSRSLSARRHWPPEAAVNPDLFFNSVRDEPFGGRMNQPQVNGCTELLRAFGPADIRFTAYGLATAYWETAHTMQPIEEIGKGRGRAYGHPAGPWSQVYDGRGDVQLTWEANYRHATVRLRALNLIGLTEDLEREPDLAMRPDIAAAIMVHGMTEGWFTGRKLADYFTPKTTDWVNARRIINGTDQAWRIAGYARSFYFAILAANSKEQSA